MSEVLLLNDVSARGSAWFERLQPVLSQYSSKEYIAIEVVSGDYAVARSTSMAMRDLSRRHPDAQFFLRRIGDEPGQELAARIFAAEGVSEK